MNPTFKFDFISILNPPSFLPISKFNIFSPIITPLDQAGTTILLALRQNPFVSKIVLTTHQISLDREHTSNMLIVQVPIDLPFPPRLHCKFDEQ
jgi:hypothetical protein